MGFDQRAYLGTDTLQRLQIIAIRPTQQRGHRLGYARLCHELAIARSGQRKAGWHPHPGMDQFTQ